MRNGRSLIVAFAIVALMTGAGSARGADTVRSYLMQGYTLDHAAVTLKPVDDNRLTVMHVADPNLRTQLRFSNLHDTLVVRTQTPVSKEIIGIDKITHPVAARTRLVVFTLSLLFVVFAAALATNWRPQRFLIGVDNRYSNSQCQIVFWFTAVATAYAAALILRAQAFGLNYFGGVGITPHLAELTGLSALTFGGAKLITVSKLTPPPTNNGAALVAPQMIKPPAARPNFVRDLVSNDHGNADFGDFQMMLVTGAVVIVFIGQMFSFLGELDLSSTVTMPNIDTTLLASFGIGQGAYLVKKAASSSGQG